MTTPILLLTALLGPYLAAFLVGMVPALGRPLLLFSSVIATVLGVSTLTADTSLTLQLLGPLGVTLSLDPLAGWFLLLDGLVFLAVLLDVWKGSIRSGSMRLMLVLLGGLSGAAVVTDLISLYVTLEVVAIAAFLLVLAEGGSESNLWVALRYLLIGNTAMSLYLVGTALVYAQTESFQLVTAASLPICAGHLFLLIGLFTKGGLFLNGLWLPTTHAAAAAPISALLSGSVVTAGVIPLVRLSLLNEALASRIGAIGLASALLGLIAALLCRDLKRLLAWSTLSQMGLLVLAPAAAGLLGLSHGLAKAALFLSCQALPTRNLRDWNLSACRPDQRLAFWIAPLSLAGLPPLIGAWAKGGELSFSGNWMKLVIALLSVLAIAVYARIWQKDPIQVQAAVQPISVGLALLVALLVSPLVAPGSWLDASLPSKLLLSGITLIAGLSLHRLLRPLLNADDSKPIEPLIFERLEHLIGGLGLIGGVLLLSLPGGVPQ